MSDLQDLVYRVGVIVYHGCAEEKRLIAGEKIDRVAFGLFEADLRSGELWKAGYRVKLSRQPFRVLSALVERPGDIVTREDLQHEIWGANTNVDFDQAIAAAVNKIREALGDSAENPRFIQTLTKRGYRFIAPVIPMRAPGVQLQESPPPLLDAASVREVSDDDVANERPSISALSLHAVTDSRQGTEAPKLVDTLPNKLPNKLSDVVAVSSEPFATVVARRRGKPLYWIGFAALLVGSVLTGRWFLAPSANVTPNRIDQITHYVPISLGPPNPESFLSMAIDGNRVLTSVMVNGRPRLSAIDVDTGEVQGIEVPDEILSNSLTDISKNGSKLLLKSQQSTESEQPLWVVPLVGGSGRRIQGVLAHDAVWMPDGTSILYATGSDLAEIGGSEDASTVYATLPGRAFWLRWSPDGKLLRFTLFDPVTHSSSLWEMASGSHVPRPVAMPGLRHTSACCGVWLPDGQSYVFQSNDNLWNLREDRGRSTLFQLTNGPLRLLSPVASRSGNRIFFIGLESPSGLQRFDADRMEFRSAPAFLADANRIDFSRDGKWVAWTDIHEKLWRAHTDGSDKVRLTPDTLEVFLAHWSPDGKRLALMARKPGGVWQTYIVDANGGRAEVLLEEARNAADPGWSEDGRRIVYGREPDLMGKESGSHALQIIDLATHRTEQIPNSETLFSPRWSPDGRWIVALTLDQKNMMLYDVSRRSWRLLASTSAADPVWDANSRFVYVHAFLADREPILKVEIPSGTIQTVADLKNFHDGEAANYFFGGITLRGEPMVQPQVGTGNLYSLDLTTH